MELERVPVEQFADAWWYRSEFSVTPSANLTYASLTFKGINYKANVRYTLFFLVTIHLQCVGLVQWCTNWKRKHSYRDIPLFHFRYPLYLFIYFPSYLLTIDYISLLMLLFRHPTRLLCKYTDPMTKWRM